MTDIVEGYTPGPWVLGPAATILGADGTRVCQVAVRIDQYDVANGLLIASAPEMADTISHLTAENERLRAALQWQPIETAPRDGTEILAVYRSVHSDWYGVAMWAETKRGEGKWFWDYAPRPSHWLPLPPPPAQESDDD